MWLEQVLAVVGTLPADTQAVFRLRIFGDWTFPQIAGALHLPENTVKSKYHRLLAMLRKEFAGYEGE